MGMSAYRDRTDLYQVLARVWLKIGASPQILKPSRCGPEVHPQLLRKGHQDLIGFVTITRLGCSVFSLEAERFAHASARTLVISIS